MATLTLLMGLPASGKSTYAREHAEGTVLHMDDIRHAVTGSYRINKVTRPLYYKVCQDAVKHFLQYGLDVVLDGNLLSKQARSPYISLAKQAGARVHVIWFDPPMDVIERRLKQRNVQVEADRQLTVKYVHTLARTHFSLPLLDEGIDAITHHTDFEIY